MDTEIPDPAKRAWYQMAQQHGSKTNSFTEVLHGTDQWKSWAGYFFALGWRPWNLASPSWTAPCEFPEDLPEFKSPAKPTIRSAQIIQFARMPAAERQAHVQRLRAEGKLNFEGDPKVDRRSWWDRMTPAHATETLQRYEREAGQQQTTDEELL